jgi:hypothetical protein
MLLGQISLDEGRQEDLLDWTMYASMRYSEVAQIVSSVASRIAGVP